ncbi:AbrB family transcriptional regulator [Polaromonas sp.]|uniref:AbrB family transcriptional regulator n=1 Tax=Polaromonas sp. TaxID=1869339 RepID=UPI003BAC1A73
MSQNFSQRFSTQSRFTPARIVLTLLLAFAAAELCVVLRTPLPWMIGPLLTTAVLSMLGTPTQSWTPLRNIGQWTIGCVLGLYFTPQVVALVAGLWWAIVLNIVWALLLGLLLGAWLHRVHEGPGPFHIAGLTRTTTYFAAPVGAASEMTLMAERHGGRTELVASAHSLRVLLVTLIIPFGFQWAGLHGLDSTLPGARVVHWPGLALLAVLTGAGCWAMLRLKRTNPWFIGALIVSLLLTAFGVTLSAVPQAMTNAAQLVIGISLGVRFTRGFMHLAPRWLGSVALATVALILLCAGFAWALAQFMPVHWATLLLGTSPGGIAEMAITAKVLQLGVPLVTAFHVTRLAAVLLIAEPMYRWLYEARGAGNFQTGRPWEN